MYVQRYRLSVISNPSIPPSPVFHIDPSHTYTVPHRTAECFDTFNTSLHIGVFDKLHWVTLRTISPRLHDIA